jgi:hypothetical protein
VAVTQRAASAAEPLPSAVRNPYSALPNWFYPTAVVVVLSLFTAYAVWVVFFNTQGRYGPYLSPFFSPEVRVWVIPPALWVAWAPLAFRLTCYYYRKAYFRGFLWHPRSCAVREPNRWTYWGETRFWAFNNLHRFAFYATALQVVVLWYDAVTAFWWNGGPHIGLGGVILLVNVLCLTGYTFGCHAFRHLAGGSKDCFSCQRVRYRLWKHVTVLNVRHDRWAWVSLFTVWFADLYIRGLITGVVPHGPWN